VAELDRELTRLGKEHEFTSYEGAGHAFFATDRPSYRPEAAKDGWRRISDFFGRHLSTPAAG
jgi:carboxymethylenebutenolidase